VKIDPYNKNKTRNSKRRQRKAITLLLGEIGEWLFKNKWYIR
jgi:hypothetical protein